MVAYRLNQPNGSPDWMRTFVLGLNAVLQGFALPTAPTKLAAFVAGSGLSDPTRTLPAASDYPDSIVWVRDIKRAAGSDGSNWIRQDTGATI